MRLLMIGGLILGLAAAIGPQDSGELVTRSCAGSVGA